MSDSCKYDCSAHPKEIQAYGDISGIGVTVAFFVTAWIIVLLLIGYYLVVYNPELDPFRKTGERTLCQYSNAIDYVFLHAFRKLLLPRRLRNSDWSRHARLESALNKCVIMYSDIQIFTGLAVMISGYHALTCGLQSYHWQLAVYLVWLSSLTHLAALSFLRNYLANNTRQLIWRVIAMFAIMVLLEVAVGLAGHFNWGKGSNKASDFAVCYFREKMDRSSVAFETMLKTLILLSYGFFIRLAKMSKRFEGRIQRVAARLSAEAMKRQHRDGGGSSPRNSPDSSIQRRPIISQAIGYLLIAGYSSLSIHLDLFTSFLAEVYWLVLSVSWATRRFVKVRKLGPKEENEWTFGQILALLLVAAPLAAVLEHFLPCQDSNHAQSQGPDQIALLIRNQAAAGLPQGEAQNQPETDEAQTEARDEARDGVRVDTNHEHTQSIAYRGTFLLAAVAYIEVGIFFVADLSPGIKVPLIRLGVAFFVLNPLLQLLWMHCALWTSHVNWSDLVKTTVRGVAFSAFMAISVNEFLQVSTKRRNDSNEPLYSIAASTITLAGGLFLSVAAIGNDHISEGEHGGLILSICIIYPTILVVLSAFLGTSFGSDGRLGFARNLGACLLFEFLYFFGELFMKTMLSKFAIYFRCMLLVGVLGALVTIQLATSIAPGTTPLTASIVLSAALWGLFGTIVSFFRGNRTVAQDESAASRHEHDLNVGVDRPDR